MKKNRENRGFTLAEVLITLAIIGVVAAIAIPVVVINYKDNQYNSMRLKALKTFGDAGKMASASDEMLGQATAKDFVNNILTKYLKITNVCDSAEECEFPNKIQPSNRDIDPITSDDLTSWSTLNNRMFSSGETPVSNKKMSTYITTNDGFSAKLFYNPKCTSNSRERPRIYEINKPPICRGNECDNQVVDSACINVIYDMNGTKGPNNVGEDVGFVTVFWSGIKTTSVAPGIIPYKTAKKLYDKDAQSNSVASKMCSQMSTNKIQYSLPSVDELSSIIINYNLTSIPLYDFWSGSPVSGTNNMMWYVGLNSFGVRVMDVPTYHLGVWCVRR